MVNLHDLVKTHCSKAMLPCFLIVFFLAEHSQAFATTRLKKPLKEENGYHFRYSSDRYSFTIDKRGAMRIGPPLGTDKVSAPALLKNNSILLYLYGVSELKKGNDHHYLESLQLKPKTNRNGFSIQSVGQLENGYRYKMNIVANETQLIFKVLHTFKGDSPLKMRLKATRATSHQKGKVLINSTTGKKYNVTCDRVFDMKKFQRCDLGDVHIINRFPFDMKITNQSEEGSLRFVQLSAQQGNPLNLSLSLRYTAVPKKFRLEFSF